MGREIRRVPADWDHPTADNWGGYKPLHDRSFKAEMAEWTADKEAWERGERPDYWVEGDTNDFIQWKGGPPNPDSYRPEWDDADRTHYQFYETVSEGSPLSPPMPTLEALEDWLATNPQWQIDEQMTREQARAMCQACWAPSIVIEEDGAGNRRVMEGVEYVTEKARRRG